MKRAVAGILVALAVVGVAFKVGSQLLASRCLKAEAVRAEALRKAELRRSLSDMIARHGAVADWQETLLDGARSRYHIYAAEVERALIRSDRRPVLFLGGLRDVAKRDTKYYAVLDAWTDLTFSVIFILEIQPEQVEQLLDDCADPLWDMYAVIAAVGSVEGTPLRLTAQPSDGDGTEISLDSQGTIVASGVCLDLLFMGHDWLEMESIMEEQGEG